MDFIDTAAPRVYILDDEENMVRILSKTLAREGFDVVSFTDPFEALHAAETHPPAVFVSDVLMPGLDGMEVLRRLRATCPSTRVVIITAFGTIDGAIQALRDGAVEYVTKPFETPHLVDKVRSAALGSIPQSRIPTPRLDSSFMMPVRRPDPASDPKSNEAALERELAKRLLGDSPAMQAVRTLVLKVAPTDSPVLIQGESGTGKEVVARAIHDYSKRFDRRFVPVNCAAIPESLVESELFGHEKGSFTGAISRKIGLIETSSGGTLLLDEVSELPLPSQAKLLRALQEREIQRVGGLDLVGVDLRLVAASNRAVEDMIEAGLFRSDLYYRLNVIRIQLPPLRERPTDIDILARHFVARYATNRETPPTLPSETLDVLRRYHWPGNVRELENAIERMLILADGAILAPDFLPEEVREGDMDTPTPTPKTPLPTSFRQAKEQFERRYLGDLLRRAGGSVTTASQLSGISRRNLYDKIEKLNIDLEPFKRGRKE